MTCTIKKYKGQGKHIKKQAEGMWYIKSKMSYASDRRLEID